MVWIKLAKIQIIERFSYKNQKVNIKIKNL